MRTRIILAVLISIVGAVGSASVAQPFRTPDGRAAPVLERIDSVEGLRAIAVRPDGLEAIGAFAIEGRDEHTLLRRYVAAQAESEETVVQGQVRDCVYAPDGLAVYGILLRPARKRAGDANLFVLDPRTLKLRSANRLPPTARDLDLWHARSALLIAAVGEVRSIFLDGLRSGSLFRITGNNRAVASVGGSATVVLGQDDALVLVDLDAPPGPDAMPERERIATSQPVSALVLAPDGRGGLARMADGSLQAIDFDPLRLAPAGSGVPVGVGAPVLQASAAATTPTPAPKLPAATSMPPPAAPAGTSSPPGLPDPDAAKAAPPSVPVASPPAQPEAAAATPPPPQTQPDAATATTAASAPAPSSQVQPDATAKSGLATPSPPVEPAATAQPPQAPAPPSAPVVFDSPATGARAWGRLMGAEAAGVREVVLFGPDNVVREAVRVVPHGGIWEVADLGPGRYRVQLDAGGDRVLVSRPAFLLIDIPPAGTVQAADCEVVSVIQPEGRR